MKPTLSIGIAAYNEAQNIGALISAFLAQKISSMHLLEIIVASDASTDETDEIVRSFSDKRVRLIRLEKRSGLSADQKKKTGSAPGPNFSRLGRRFFAGGPSPREKLGPKIWARGPTNNKPWAC